MCVTLVFKDFSGSYTWSRLVLFLFSFYVSGRGLGGDGASGGGLVVDDALIDGSDGWWLECSKSITRENRERSPHPPPPPHPLPPEEEYSVFIFCVFF